MSATPIPSPTPGPSGPKIPSELPVHFVKTGGFRVVHADGAWLSANSFGCFYLTFYSEHTPVPKKIVVKLNEQGNAIDEDFSRREVLDGLTREVEVEVALTIPAALQLVNVLSTNLQNMKTALEKEQAEGKK
jgi:hypothetical protein